MKKIFLALLAVSIMTACFANDGTPIKKHHHRVKKTCPMGCCDGTNCHKTAICNTIPGCICS